MKEQVYEYLQTNKKPITIKRLAKHFIASDSAIHRAIQELDAERKISTINGKPMKYVIR